MFQKIKEKRRAKQLLREWKKEHWEHLPNYHPETGQKLDWKIHVARGGPFDKETGEPLGELFVFVEQLPPKILIDAKVYGYDEHNKQIYRLPARWGDHV